MTEHRREEVVTHGDLMRIVILGAAFLLWLLRRVVIKTCRQAGVDWKGARRG